MTHNRPLFNIYLILLILFWSSSACSKKQSKHAQEISISSQTEQTTGPTESPSQSEEKATSYQKADTEKPTSSNDGTLSSEKLRAVQNNFSVDTEKLRKGILDRYSLQEPEEPDTEIAYLLDKYESGDNSVSVDLALMLSYVGNTQEQIDQAKLILELAAEDGEPRAFSELARLLLLGYGDEIKQSEISYYLEQAVAANEPEGTYLLGIAHRLNLLKDSTFQIGTELLETAAELGHGKAATTLYINLTNTAELKTGTPSERKQMTKKLLESYPNMEDWLTNAAQQGDAPEFERLADFYLYTDRTKLGQETLHTAAQLGSFDALSRIIRETPRVVNDKEFRDAIKELLEVHLVSTPSRQGSANYLMACMHNFEDPNDESRDLAKQHLEQALEEKEYRAGIALIKLEEGSTLREAMNYSYYGDDSQVYANYLELSQNTKYPQQSNRTPYPRRMGTAIYPPELGAEAIAGEVLIQATVNPDGSISQAEVIRSTHSSFESYALDAMLNSEFEPAMENGKPVVSRIRIPFRFKPNK